MLQKCVQYAVLTAAYKVTDISELHHKQILDIASRVVHLDMSHKLKVLGGQLASLPFIELDQAPFQGWKQAITKSLFQGNDPREQ